MRQAYKAETLEGMIENFELSGLEADSPFYVDIDVARNGEGVASCLSENRAGVTAVQIMGVRESVHRHYSASGRKRAIPRRILHTGARVCWHLPDLPCHSTTFYEIFLSL